MYKIQSNDCKSLQNCMHLTDYDNTRITSAKEIGEHLKETAVVPFTSILCSWYVCYNHSFFSLRIKNNNAHIKKHLARSTRCAYDFQYQYHFANLLCMLQDEASALKTKFCSYSYLQFPFFYSGILSLEIFGITRNSYQR